MNQAILDDLNALVNDRDSVFYTESLDSPRDFADYLISNYLNVHIDDFTDAQRDSLEREIEQFIIARR